MAVTANYVDIFIEIKIKESFTTAHTAIDDSHEPLRLDVTDKRGGLLVYVRSYLPLRQLTTLFIVLVHL